MMTPFCSMHSIGCQVNMRVEKDEEGWMFSGAPVGAV